MSPPSRTCMLARTTCSFTLAVPTNLMVIVPTLKVGGASPAVVGAAGCWAKTGLTPVNQHPTATKIETATLRTGLLMEVFKAGDVSKESEFRFSYRAVSLLGND